MVPGHAATPSRTSARGRCEPVALVGRAEVVADLVNHLTEPTERAVSFVLGATGTGRSALLAGVAEAVGRAGQRPCLVRGTPGDRTTPYRLLYRVVSSLITKDHRRESDIPRLLGAIAGACADAEQGHAHELTARIADALANLLVHGAPTALLVDDAHYADAATLRLLGSLAPRMSGRRCGLVLASRTGDAARLPVVDERFSGKVTLGDLDRIDTDRLIRTVLRANADPDLVDAVSVATRGNPGAVVDVLDALLRNGRIVPVDGHAHLLPGASPMLEPTSATVASIRALGETAWKVAKAIAALGPAGANVRTLPQCAEITAIAHTATEEGLRELELAQVIEYGPESAGWQYRLPAVGRTIATMAGPYERQAIAVLALDQLRAGELDIADEAQVANLLVESRHVIPADDRQAAAAFLQAAAGRAASDDQQSTAWRQVAFELRAGGEALADTVEHALQCAHQSHWTEVVAASQQIFAGHAGQLSALPASRLPELLVAWTTALGALGRRDELSALADHGHRSLPLSPALRQLTGCAALVQLGRWRAAEELLNAVEPHFATAPDSRAAAEHLRATVNLALGIRALHRDPGQPVWTAGTARAAGVLCSLGDLTAADNLLAEQGLDRSVLNGREGVFAAYQAGDWDSAARQARILHARNEAVGGPMPGSVYRHAATMHTACGRFAAARQWISAAASRGVATDDPCLRLAEAHIEGEIGNSDAARRLLHDVLDDEQTGHRANLDEALSALLQIEIEAGRRTAAAAALDRLHHVAEATGTGRSKLLYLRGKAAVTHDLTSAAAAVALAEERQQPFETAMTYWYAALLGLRTDQLLSAAYELFGGLDALVWRAKVRSATRTAGIPVPRRDATIGENERLMAAMVADGLSNRELAQVMKTTAKSIEGQLTRMFARMGLRSRVELVGSFSMRTAAVIAD